MEILFAGDYHIYGAFDAFLKKYPAHQIFKKNLNRLTSNSDFNVFNLEDPITNNRNGILKHGPHGVGSEESLGPIKKAGFNLATFATNHTYDMGDQGIRDTFSACRKHGIEIVGAGLTREEARKPFFKKIKGFAIAILNFSRSEFNSVSENHGGSNPLDVVSNARDIIDAKKKADFVFVVVHEGVDVFHLPYPRLVEQMRFYADMGADAIVLHHSRIVSGYEIYNGTPIFYGIGNLLHLSKNKAEYQGLLVKFQVDKNTGLDFELIPIELNPGEVVVRVCKGEKKDRLLMEVDRLSGIIKDSAKLEAGWQQFVLSRKTQYLSILSGYPGIFPRVSRKLGMQSMYEKILLFNKKKYLSKWNIMKCQAHYEAVNFILRDIFEKRKK